jgi:Phage-related protein
MRTFWKKAWILKTIGLPPEDAQFLETRKFQVTEIARIFRVPPHMIGDVEKSTSWGTGIDSQEQGYVNHNLRPWTRRIEQSLKQQVLLPEERKNRYWEHLFDDLLRGDLVTRYGAYAQAITNGIMSPNEVRERENMNPYEGGDIYLTPLNMTSSPRNTGTEQPQQPARRNVLAPLWHDAVQRAVKRETNDVRGAARRFLAKGQPEAFQQWLSQFYEVDHPEFMIRIFQPILQAQKNLCGSADGWLGEYVAAYSAERKAQVGQLQAAELESEIDEWPESLPGKLT